MKRRLTLIAVIVTVTTLSVSARAQTCLRCTYQATINDCIKCAEAYEGNRLRGERNIRNFCTANQPACSQQAKAKAKPSAKR